MNIFQNNICLKRKWYCKIILHQVKNFSIPRELRGTILPGNSMKGNDYKP
jgi:hypothetical protein